MKRIIILFISVMFLCSCSLNDQFDFKEHLPYPDSIQQLYQEDLGKGIIFLFEDDSGFRHAYVSKKKLNWVMQSSNAFLQPEEGIDWTMINGGPEVDVASFAGVITDEQIQHVYVKQRTITKKAKIIDLKPGLRTWFVTFDKLESSQPGQSDPLKIEALNNQNIIVWKDGVYNDVSSKSSIWNPSEAEVLETRQKLRANPGGNYRAGIRSGCWWNIYLPYDDIKEKAIEIKAIHKDTGTELYELPYTFIKEVGHNYSENLTRVPTHFNLPLAGLWSFEVYIDNRLWGRVNFNLPS